METYFYSSDLTSYECYGLEYNQYNQYQQNQQYQLYQQYQNYQLYQQYQQTQPKSQYPQFLQHPQHPQQPQHYHHQQPQQPQYHPQQYQQQQQLQYQQLVTTCSLTTTVITNYSIRYDLKSVSVSNKLADSVTKPNNLENLNSVYINGIMLNQSYICTDNVVNVQY
ncbi:uncharacterized protein OCT59_002402 [Rhizophagus irregularis]|uniref:uncharacterized protein n=1 Tax=Rhizophagus irregularis TaxID=588596 RepID=UPI000CAF041C|nr:hypothetical protein OCT59_002402 [Rhizophagus irregularis]GBC18120.1 hypothetical protein GLOIN_2v1879214 [Rhizophagus irregularis DAOM 181602=DAOM 197198]